MTDEMKEILRIIAKTPPDSQVRIKVMADILRDLLAASGDEAMLAFTLVMEEIAELEDTDDPKTH